MSQKCTEVYLQDFKVAELVHRQHDFSEKIMNSLSLWG